MNKSCSFTNTSRYSSKEVRLLVGFAYAETFKAWPNKPRIRIRVTNSRHAFCGYAYPTRVTLRIGHESQFPRTTKYPRLVTAPEIALSDWMEALIHLAAHEFWHCYQFQTRSPRSEIECEHRSIAVLESFRSNRPEFDARIAEMRQADVARVAVVKERRAVRNGPEAKLAKLEDDKTRWQRKLKLATTKLRKINRKIAYYQRAVTS